MNDRTRINRNRAIEYTAAIDTLDGLRKVITALIEEHGEDTPVASVSAVRPELWEGLQWPLDVSITIVDEEGSPPCAS